MDEQPLLSRQESLTRAHAGISTAAPPPPPQQLSRLVSGQGDGYHEQGHEHKLQSQDVVNIMSRYPVETLQDHEHESMTIKYSNLIEESTEVAQELGRLVLEHGFAVISMDEGSYDVIGNMWDALRDFMARGFEDKMKAWASADNAGWIDAYPAFEQYNFVYQSGLGTELEQNRSEWPIRADLTAGIKGDKTIGERSSGLDPNYSWPEPDTQPPFKYSTIEYYKFMERFGRLVMKLLSLFCINKATVILVS